MSRILVVAPGPSFSVADVQRGWENGLRALGHEVQTYNLDDRMSFFGAAEVGGEKLTPEQVHALAVGDIGNKCYQFWPDIILIVSGFFIPDLIWKVWKHRPHKTVWLCTESPYEDNTHLGRMFEWEPDIVLLNDPTNIEVFREHHDNVWYAPHSYDPMVHHPGVVQPEYECDFGFVGTGYKSRVNTLARVDWRGLDVKFAGQWGSVGGTCLEDFVIHPLLDCIDNDDAVKLYQSCKMSANLYRHEANDERLSQGWSMGPRELELAACGTFFAREPRGEGDDLFPMLPKFTDARELSDIIRYYLTHDDERHTAASAARAAIVDRTFEKNARDLMRLLSA